MTKSKTVSTLVLTAVMICVAAGCRTSYYAVMEKMGKPKRALLKSSLQDASIEQVQANDQFKETLLKLKEVYGFDGGDLESRYRDFQKEYERSVSQAEVVRKRVNDVEQIGTDLFREWREEIQEITSPGIKFASQKKLSETESRFSDLLVSLKKSEATMDPVLSQMKDYTLYLKHNLNALAVGSLKEEAGAIEKEILKLISEMNRSISETEVFLTTLGP